MALTEQQISTLKTKLIEAQQETSSALDKDMSRLTKPELADLSEAHGGGIDDAVYDSQVNFDVARSIGDSDRLTSIGRALDLIDIGKYGTCTTCDDAIDYARLEALPWALRCLSCERELEITQDERDATPSL